MMRKYLFKMLCNNGPSPRPLLLSFPLNYQFQRIKISCVQDAPKPTALSYESPEDVAPTILNFITWNFSPFDEAVKLMCEKPEASVVAYNKKLPNIFGLLTLLARTKKS